MRNIAAFIFAALLSARISSHVFAADPDDNAGVGRPLTTSTFRDINKIARPWVVRIIVTVKPDPAQPLAPKNQKGFGTGFLAGKGRVFTNNHVIEHAATITVELPDGRLIAATLLGGSKEVDFAILKIEVSPTDASYGITAHLGDSSRVEVGDWVIAIGNALGLGTSMTIGIVSATGTNYEINKGPTEYIQTDAAINRGNSGGPLLNIDGEVIGINTSMMAGPGVSGIGFAIPINYAKDMTERLSSGQDMSNGWIGVKADLPLTDDRELWHLPAKSGVIITVITPGSPAEASGLKRNDFIMSVNGKSFTGVKEFNWLIRNAEISVRLAISRDGKELILDIPVKDDPAPQKE